MEYLIVNVNELHGKMSDVIKAVYANHQDKTLLLFYMQNSATPVITMEDAKLISYLRMTPQYIACNGSDDDIIMQIASDIGYRIGVASWDDTNITKNDKYIIVSNNSSYNKLAAFWRDHDISCIKLMSPHALLNSPILETVPETAVEA